MPDPQRTIDRRILSYNRPARVFLALATACGLMAAALVVGFAFALSRVIARVFLAGAGLEDVRKLLLVLLLLALGRAVFLWSADVLSQRAASHLKGSMRADVTQRISTLGPAFTHSERSGELVNAAVQGVEDLDEYITVYQPLRALALLVPLFVALVVFAIDPLTVLILVVTGPLLVLFLALIGSRTKEITERRFVEVSWMSASFLDMLQGLTTLKMFGRSREQVQNIRDISKRYGDATMDVLRTAFETALVLELSTTIATALVAVEISIRLIAGDVAFDRSLAVLLITPEFFFPLRQLAAKYHAGAAGRTAAERLFQILDSAPGNIEPRPHADAVTVPARADIRFEGVTFAYDNGRRPALRDASMRIVSGETTALVGPSGAGKTTIASLLLRFIEPDGGCIYVGGRRLDAFGRAAWRSQVAWVPQQPHLFYGSAADNIRLARPGATDEDVIAAAQAAHAHEFITALPRGYDTLIGERGARLSGGEQQRLAIARAFLKDAPFLILDEATSHLDADSEAIVRTALTRLMRGRTVLIIAHRLEMASRADRVIVLEDGRTVESGDHQALMEKGGMYRQLVAGYEGGSR